MLKADFIHNTYDRKTGRIPYEELKYLEIQAKYLEKSQQLSKQEIKEMTKEVKEAQTRSLASFL